MPSKRVVSLSSLWKPLFFWVVLALTLSQHVAAEWEEQRSWVLEPLVKRNQRETIISTEYGDVSEARVADGNESFRLHFIRLEPNSLFLPVLLHSDMVFYVHTGSGRLSYQDEDKKEHRRLRRGDVHRLRTGTVFFIQSDLEPERQKLRIIAIFDNSEQDFNEPACGPYSSISNLLRGFDKEVLRAAFKVPEGVIEEIVNGTKPPAIMHGLQKKKDKIWGIEYEIMENVYNVLDFSNKHKKSKLFNIFGEDPDFENCKGWSTTVNKKKYGPLRGSKFGIFMVNLTTGSMMGPHWNPVATEIAIVLQGKGMVRVVCSSFVNQSMCKNTRFRVEEGDVFVVPKFHPMAQMAFNNETFVFMGFSTSVKKNHPQYFAGKASVLRTLDKHIVATSFGVNDTTLEKLLVQQDDLVILDCTSCAEEEWRRMKEEIEKERERERKREKEEARRKEEERRREEEKARKKEEEEAKRREEEAQRQREEEEAQRREQEEREARERAEEEARRKREEEEARRRREEEERKRQEQEERERQEEQKREQAEREAWERAREQAQQAERERQEVARREEEAAKQAEAEAAAAAEEAQRRREEEGGERQGQGQVEERKREAAAEAQRRREEEERERQKQQQQHEQAERERQAQQQRAQEGREAREREREQERAREAEREKEAAARREEEAARQEEEAAARGQGQGGSEGEEGQQEGRREQEERGGQEPEVREEAAAEQDKAEERRGKEAPHGGGAGQEEPGRGQGWARRILKKTA